MVDDVSSVAEETAAEASNVSAASEEQTSSLTDVGQNVENLSKVAEELHELVEQFETKQTGISVEGQNSMATQTAAATDGGSKPDRVDDVIEWQESSR